jgi:hypothetical protein
MIFHIMLIIPHPQINQALFINSVPISILCYRNTLFKCSIVSGEPFNYVLDIFFLIVSTALISDHKITPFEGGKIDKCREKLY